MCGRSFCEKICAPGRPINPRLTRGYAASLASAYQVCAYRGEGEAAITESIKEIKESPFSIILNYHLGSIQYIVPSTTPLDIFLGSNFVKFVHPVYNFAYKVVDKNPTGPQTALQTLFAEWKKYNDRLG